MMNRIEAEDVEARLIEAVRVFERMEHKGAAWATDGPWHLSLLASHREAVVHALELGEAIEAAVFDPRPDRDSIARAEEAASWLGMVPEWDRPLVLAGVRGLAFGAGRVPWTRLLMAPELVRDASARGVATAAGLARRYRKALDVLARRLRLMALRAAA